MEYLWIKVDFSAFYGILVKDIRYFGDFLILIFLFRGINMTTIASRPMSPDLESFTLVNWIQVLVMPHITDYVKKKKERWSKGLRKSNFILFDGLSPHLDLIRSTAGQSRSLLEIYNFFPNLKWYHTFHPSIWISAFWESMLNAKAVRNRYRLTKSTLSSAISLKGDGARILELAAGTSQALLETIASCKKNGIRVFATLVDVSEISLAEARQLALQLGVEDQIETVVQDLVSYLKNNHKTKRFDVIEMVGIADYLSDKTLAFTYSLSYKMLQRGGKLITANIHDNHEKDFVHTVIDWPSMFYRNLAHMRDVLQDAGFTVPHVFKEPTEVYVIGVGQKE